MAAAAVDLLARQPECRGARGHRLGDERGRGRRPVHRVLLDRVAAVVDDGDGDATPRAGLAHRPIGESERPRMLGLVGRRRVAVAEPLLGGEVAERLEPALLIVTVLALVGSPSAHSTIRSSELAGLPSAISIRRLTPGCHERPDGGAGCAEAGDDTVPSSRDRHPAGTRESRLRRAGDEARGDRRWQRCHTYVVHGARDLLGGGDPRLRARPRHPTRAAAVHAGGGHEDTAAADDGEPAAHADMGGLVDRALDQLARGRERDVTRVQSRPAPRRAPAAPPTGGPCCRAGPSGRPA